MMKDPDAQWEKRVAELWKTIDDHDASQFLARIDGLVTELPAGHAIGLFERAAAHDSFGDPHRAIPLDRAALAAGLAGLRRRPALSHYLPRYN